MTLSEMDKDLSRFTEFQKLSERVGYWQRRWALIPHDDDESERFDGVVAKHSKRVLAVLRAI
jgi:LmbE family N-acetylglucosaminyl deacetylase